METSSAHQSIALSKKKKTAKPIGQRRCGHDKRVAGVLCCTYGEVDLLEAETGRVAMAADGLKHPLHGLIR